MCASSSPGHNFNLESAPFKLTNEVRCRNVFPLARPATDTRSNPACLLQIAARARKAARSTVDFVLPNHDLGLNTLIHNYHFFSSKNQKYSPSKPRSFLFLRGMGAPVLAQMVEMMGGVRSKSFRIFRSHFCKGLLELKKRRESSSHCVPQTVLEFAVCDGSAI